MCVMRGTDLSTPRPQAEAGMNRLIAGWLGALEGYGEVPEKSLGCLGQWERTQGLRGMTLYQQAGKYFRILVTGTDRPTYTR